MKTAEGLPIFILGSKEMKTVVDLQNYFFAAVGQYHLGLLRLRELDAIEEQVRASIALAKMTLYALDNNLTEKSA